MCSIMFDFGCVSGGLLTYLWLIQSTSVQWLVTPFNTRLQLSFSLSSKSQVVSIVLSSQVGNGLTATAVSKDTLESNPISLTFNLISVCYYSCCSMFVVYYGLYIFAGKWNNQIQVCVLEFFWTVSCNSYNLICVSQLNLTRTLCYSLYSVGSGSWVTDGISITDNMTVGNVTSVQCQSTHLTSFAVLVDVAGGLQVCAGCQMWQNIVTYGFVFWLALFFWQDIPEVERKALQIVSYIGCAISTFCLIIAVLFFIMQGYG